MLSDGIIEASARGPRIRQEETQIAGSRTTMGDGVDANPEGRPECFAAASRGLPRVRPMADGVRDGRGLARGCSRGRWAPVCSQVSDRVRAMGAGWERGAAGGMGDGSMLQAATATGLWRARSSGRHAPEGKAGRRGRAGVK